MIKGNQIRIMHRKMFENLFAAISPEVELSSYSKFKLVAIVSGIKIR